MMSKIKSIQQVVRYGLCISCGACVSAAPAGAMEMVADEKSGIYVPKIVDLARVSGEGLEFSVCPGKGLPIKKTVEELYNLAPHNTFELGRYRVAIAARTLNQRILENASSGGVMTEIAKYCIEKDLVQGVTASRFVYGPPGPRTESFIACSLDDLLSAQGSKYCPTVTNQLVRGCVEAGGRYLFVGTPCQVGALRLAMREDRSLTEVFPYTMANFCGGYRDFRHLDAIIRFSGIEPGQVEYFQFRGSGQPGSMLARSADGRVATAPYPVYLRRSDLPKQKRCSYCVDSTGELADFACGDAWIDRLLQTKYSWSIILARSDSAEQIVNELATSGYIETTSVSFEEIRDSQRQNIESKKFRQYKRRRLSRLLGITMPEWDVKLPRGKGTYLYEVRVLFAKTALARLLCRIRNAVKDFFWTENLN